MMIIHLFFLQGDFNCLYGGGAQLGAIEWKNGDVEPYINFDSYINK